MSTSRYLVLWARRSVLWLCNHWLAVFNTFFGLFVGLAFAAPVLAANGFETAAHTLYSLYAVTCHQLPSRSYFVLGQQVAICHRDVAIYATLWVGGLIFQGVRGWLKPPALRWYVFFLAPLALDAGMAMASEWLQFTTMTMLWAIGLIALGITSEILRRYRYLTWHSYLFFAFGPLALIYLHFFGPYQSDWARRTLTGFIFGAGTIWFAYPHFEAVFNDFRVQVIAKLQTANSK
jgi:uncharacterized membrane protein